MDLVEDTAIAIDIATSTAVDITTIKEPTAIPAAVEEIASSTTGAAGEVALVPVAMAQNIAIAMFALRRPVEGLAVPRFRRPVAVTQAVVKSTAW